MKKEKWMLALLIMAVCFMTGCMTNEQFLQVDTLTKKIAALRAESQTKIEEARSGDLTITEALAWVRHADEEISQAGKDLAAVKKGSGVGWAELAGSVLVSMVGGTGLVKAWRGPSHKNTAIPS